MHGRFIFLSSNTQDFIEVYSSMTWCNSMPENSWALILRTSLRYVSQSVLAVLVFAFLSSNTQDFIEVAVAALRRKDEHRVSLFRLLYWLMFLCLRNTSQKAGGGHDALSPSFRFAGLWRICKSARDPSSFTFPYPIPFVPEGKSIVASMT